VNTNKIGTKEKWARPRWTWTWLKPKKSQIWLKLRKTQTRSRLGNTCTWQTRKIMNTQWRLKSSWITPKKAHAKDQEEKKHNDSKTIFSEDKKILRTWPRKQRCKHANKTYTHILLWCGYQRNIKDFFHCPHFYYNPYKLLKFQLTSLSKLQMQVKTSSS